MSELARQVLLFGAIGVLVAACGSSDSQDSPPLPVVDIDADSQLVDVGQQYRLDASGSYNPEKDSLEYFWTVLRPPRSRAEIQDHCADDFEEVCIANYSACAGTQDICATNADCDTDIQCLEDAASTSPDLHDRSVCHRRRRGIRGNDFAADTVGPYVARVLVSTRSRDRTT